MRGTICLLVLVLVFLIASITAQTVTTQQQQVDVLTVEAVDTIKQLLGALRSSLEEESKVRSDVILTYKNQLDESLVAVENAKNKQKREEDLLAQIKAALENQQKVVQQAMNAVTSAEVTAKQNNQLLESSRTFYDTYMKNVNDEKLLLDQIEAILNELRENALKKQQAAK